MRYPSGEVQRERFGEDCFYLGLRLGYKPAVSEMEDAPKLESP